MDSDGVTHISDDTQNDMPIEQATGYPALRHWLDDPDLPRYPNTQQIDDSPMVTNTNRGYTGRHHAHIRQTYTTLAEAATGLRGGSRIEELQSNLLGLSNDEVDIETVDSSAGNMSPSQRLIDYPTVLQFYLETSIGIGSHLNSPSEARSHGDVLSNELGNIFTRGPTDHLLARRIGREVFADSLIHLFESTAVLFYCTFCNVTSSSYWLWRRHEREQHLLSDDAAVDIGTEDLRCYFCNIDAANINERAEHIACHFFWQGLTKADWDAHKAATLDSRPLELFLWTIELKWNFPFFGLFSWILHQAEYELHDY